jgi:hypothetical protein
MSLLQRYSVREFVDDISLREELDIVSRLYQLRLARRIGVVLADSGRYWIAESEGDPWGTAVRYSVAQLKDLVERLEKKPPVSETGGSMREAKSA